MIDYLIAATIIGAVGLGIYLTVRKKKDESGATRRAGNGSKKSRR